MTNEQSFLKISGDRGIMSLLFATYNIDAGLEDKNEIAQACGAIARVMQSDETQGKSSLKISNAARVGYKNLANTLLAKNDLFYDWNDSQESEITAPLWV